MNQNDGPAPPADAPTYVVDGLRRQPADRLRELATWARTLAEYKDAVEAPDSERQAQIRERVADAGYSTDTTDYAGVPERAYITVKEPREGYEYAYWQWRSRSDVQAPDKNEAIGPLE